LSPQDTQVCGQPITTLARATNITEVWQAAFSVDGLAAWNSLPIDIRAISRTPAFKKKLKTFLFHKFYDISVH